MNQTEFTSGIGGPMCGNFGEDNNGVSLFNGAIDINKLNILKTVLTKLNSTSNKNLLVIFFQKSNTCICR